MIKILRLLKEKIIKMLKRDVRLIETQNSESEMEFKSKEEKRDFFELYKNVKNGKIKKEQLLITDLIKVELMLEQEKEIYNEKIRSEEKEIMQLDTQIKKLKIERRNLNP